MSAALGILAGTLVRRRQAVIPLSLGITLPIFFVSGPFGPVKWGNAVVAALAQGEPVYYGIAVFQHAFHGFETTATSQVFNSLILVGFAVVALVISASVLRWRGVAH